MDRGVKLAFLSLLVCLWMGAAFAQTANALKLSGPSARESSASDDISSELRDQVYNLEHDLAAAEVKQDRDFFQNSLAENFIYVAHNGLVFTKQQIVGSLRYIDVQRYEIQNMKVRQLGPDAALATYDLNIRGDIAGEHLPGKQYASSVWVKTPEGWKLIFHQSTPARHD